MLGTVRTVWDKICFVLKKSQRAGCEINVGFEQVKVEKEDADAVYLTIEELNRIEKLTNLSKTEKEVRDMFLIGCHTVLRYSDYSNLTSSNIIKDKIKIKTKKTGVRVVLPIHPAVKRVLARNGNDFPRVQISQQSFNKSMKIICKKAKISNYVLVERTYGNKTVRKRVRQYSLITSHTARRTAATNMYLAGIAAARIMLFTGHQTEQAFFRYIRIGREENAEVLGRHEFFRG